MSKTYIFDIETNGLLDTLDTVHVLGVHTEDGRKVACRGEQIEKALRKWETEGATLIGHNVIGFDIPALKKVYGFDETKVKVIDTLVLARFIFPDLLPDDDKLSKKGKLPARLMGSQSLEAWGYRLGEHKGDFKGPWDVCTPEMVEYCLQDLMVTHKLYLHLMKQEPSAEAIELEHAVQWIIQRQVRHGVCFNTERAIELNLELNDRLHALTAELTAAFGSWYKQQTREDGVIVTKTPPRDNKRFGYVAGAEYTPVTLVEFNPGSRLHIIRVLTQRYGWKPTKFTETGQPKVDDEVLAGLTYPLVDKLAQYLLVKKRIGQLSDGQNGWLRKVKHGRIHGDVNTNGAVTGRMTHANPNLAQVPAVRQGKEGPLMGEAGGWGYEMRQLFTVPRGMKLVGCDASGLELRMLAHFMARYDGGAYAEIVVNGKKEDGTDIHTVNMKAAGLPTRDNAKTFIYAFLYGGGDAKVGSIVGKGAEAGAVLKGRFLEGLPALARLKADLEAAFEARGYVKGLDGRKLYIGSSARKHGDSRRWERSLHKALNTLLQSAGALVMKKALVILDTRLQAGGLIPGKDYAFVLNIHDEFQLECLEEHAGLVAELARLSIEDAGKAFRMRCQLDGEARAGNNWAETH